MTERFDEMFQGIDAIIFDMDGTLIDSMWVWEAVDLDFFEKYQLPEPEKFGETLEGKSYTESAQALLEAFPDLPMTVEEVKDEWTQMAVEKYMTEVPLKKGARKFLENQKRKGLKLGIATSNTAEIVDITLNTLGLTEYFDSVHTACEVKHGKPAPDVYLMVAGELGADPERCLVFEDVPNGILAGKNAGMRTCAVEDFYSSSQKKKKQELADYYIQDYDELNNAC